MARLYTAHNAEKKWYCPNIGCTKYCMTVISALTAPKCSNCKTDLMLV